MKTKTLLLLLFVSVLTLEAKSIYDFKVTDISGNSFDMASLKGKRVMIVNTASKCGFTKQYEDLQWLYEKYKDQNFVIIGFPANNFMKQEPGSDEEIQSFCKLNYGVTFPMMSKISVKGNDIAPLYEYLTKETNSNIKWNFQKFLINTDGSIDAVIESKTKPNVDSIQTWIKTGKYENK